MAVGGAAEAAAAPAATADAAARAAGEQEGGPGEQGEQPLAPGAGGQPVGPQVEAVPPSGGGDVEKAGGAPGAAGAGAMGAPKTRAGAIPSTKRAESAAKEKVGKQVAPAAVEKAKDAAALVYGAEAVLPTELKYGSPRVCAYDKDSQCTQRIDDVNFLEEVRCRAAVRSARYQQGLRR